MACLVLGSLVAAAEPVVVEGAQARQPQAVIDGDGRVHLVFGAGSTILYTVWTAGGRSFETPRTVGSVEALSLGARRGPRLAATPQGVVVTAIGGRQGMGRDGDLLAWRSTDGGQTWHGPTRVNTVDGSAREGLHAMTARSDGVVVCVWLDLRHQKMELFGARSLDGGATWDADQLIYQSPDGSICECCHPSATFAPDGALYVMWRNQIRGARDMYLTRSRDAGQTFQPAQKLGLGTWKLNTCPMDGGAVSVGTTGSVITAWRRDSAVFVAEPGAPERQLGRGAQPWCAMGKDGALIVWLGPKATMHQPDALFARLPGDSRPVQLADQAGSPVLVADPNGDRPSVVFWEGPEGIMALRLQAEDP